MSTRTGTDSDGAEAWTADERPDAVAGDGLTDKRSPVTIAAVVAVVGAFAAIAGPRGVIAGLATATVWYIAGTPYAVGAGHVALVGLFPNEIDPLSFAVGEAAFVALVLASGPRTSVRAPVRYGAAVLASAGALAGITWFALVPAAQPIWIATSVLLVTLCCVAYGTHRYELVFTLDRIQRGREGTASRPRASGGSDESSPPADTDDGDFDLVSDTEP